MPKPLKKLALLNILYSHLKAHLNELNGNCSRLAQNKELQRKHQEDLSMSPNEVVPHDQPQGLVTLFNFGTDNNKASSNTHVNPISLVKPLDLSPIKLPSF